MTNVPARTVAFISNKGGVGKTHIAISLALQFAREGRRVLLIDTDLGSANTDIRLGIRPSSTLNDFYEKRVDIFDCLIPTKYGFHFLAGKSGEFKLANLGHQQKIRLLKGFDRLVRDGGYTDILFDLGAGIGSRVLDFALVSDEMVIVATPQDIVAAYAALKACWIRYTRLSDMHYFKNKQIFLSGDGMGIPGEQRLRINFVVNMVDNLEEGKRVYLRILDVARMFFYTKDGKSQLPLRYLGGIPYVQGLLRQAERGMVPVTVMFPHHPFTRAIREISSLYLKTKAIAPNRLHVPFSDRVLGVVKAWVG